MYKTLVLVAITLLAGCQGTPAPVLMAGRAFSIERVMPGDVLPAPGSTLGPADTSEMTEPPEDLSREPVPTPSQAAPRSPGGTGGGGSGPATPGSRPAGRVLDDAEVPIAGATVMLANGRTAVTDAEGRYAFPAIAPTGPVAVSKAGYATSLLTSFMLGESDVLHLRRIDRTTDRFNQETYRIEGGVNWPSADHVGGVAYYQDNLGSAVQPARLDPDGRFALTVTPGRPGAPVGTVLVFATTSDQQTLLVGSSTPFSPALGEQPGTLAIAPCDRPVSFNSEALPGGLTVAETRLELSFPGLPPIALDTAETLAGSFRLPAVGALPGTVRIVSEARSVDGASTSLVAMVPETDTVMGRFLALPDLAVNPGARQVAWAAVPGAQGYRLEARTSLEALPHWESWITGATLVTLPENTWSFDREAVLQLEAVDAPELGTREVASVGPLFLRIAPWAQRPTYRVASQRVSF